MKSDSICLYLYHCLARGYHVPLEKCIDGETKYAWVMEVKEGRIVKEKAEEEKEKGERWIRQISKFDLYNHYKVFCNKEGLQAEGEKQFWYKLAHYIPYQDTIEKEGNESKKKQRIRHKLRIYGHLKERLMFQCVAPNNREPLLDFLKDHLSLTNKLSLISESVVRKGQQEKEKKKEQKVRITLTYIILPSYEKAVELFQKRTGMIVHKGGGEKRERDTNKEESTSKVVKKNKMDLLHLLN